MQVFLWFSYGFPVDLKAEGSSDEQIQRLQVELKVAQWATGPAAGAGRARPAQLFLQRGH